MIKCGNEKQQTREKVINLATDKVVVSLDILKSLRQCAEAESCKYCNRFKSKGSSIKCRNKLMHEAASLIEKQDMLLKKGIHKNE